MKKYSELTEQEKQHLREISRKCYARHREERCRKYREKYQKNRKKYLDLQRAFRMSHPEYARKKSREHYRRIKSDPDRAAAYNERKARWRLANKERVNARRREIRAAHKRRERRNRRWWLDRRKVLFRQCPELYAAFRAHRRVLQMKWWRKRHPNAGVYRAKICMRIPDHCPYGRVLDRRSVFLWNNLPAASLVAGRAYRAMQWREAHCDRFGMVCR